eukprot:NODE_8146_length_720_cov_694.197655_g7894_i0.p1 GENE.NODE_8146_length_720_cov_694.197655_g7894_i0~~NODE_8146_length_720_cov_694.197655_g7894_i0.p1  ORF type:complete len:195 (-),score=42.04 NODE_8146_length_720_cov_694.197655_g7894_i0:84-668(-)
MGIDKTGLVSKKGGRKKAVCQNPYVRVLIKIYKFLARRAKCPFNRVVAKRLMMSRNNRPPVSTSKICRVLRKRVNWRKIAVVCADVTADTRRIFLPKLTVCAMRFTATARARIEASGGRCMSFDQLALVAPTGSNCQLIRGKKSTRKECKSYGAPGVPGSHAVPKMGGRKPAMRGRKFERARGRRKSHHWKVKS